MGSRESVDSNGRFSFGGIWNDYHLNEASTMDSDTYEELDSACLQMSLAH
jgi:hypothetical protein